LVSCPTIDVFQVLSEFRRPGQVANRNPIDIELPLPESHFFSDYDNDNDNDNDNDCIRSSYLRSFAFICGQNAA